MLALAIWAVMHAKDQITNSGLAIAGDRRLAARIGDVERPLHRKGHRRNWRGIALAIHAASTPTGTGYAWAITKSKWDVDRKDLKVRARPGYYVTGPRATG